MRHIILIYAIFFATACQNVMSPKVNVPDHMELEGETTIRHEIVISVEMKELFQDECVKELPEDASEEEFNICYRQKEQEYVRLILELIQSTESSKK